MRVSQSPGIRYDLHPADRGRLTPDFRYPATGTRFATDLLCTIDRAGRIVQANDAWRESLGYNSEELSGRRLADLCLDGDQAVVARELGRLAGGATSVAFECRLTSPRGEAGWFAWYIVRDAEGELSQAVGRDISRQKHAEQMLAYQTHYDVITGLPNRYLFSDRLEQEISAAQAAGDSFALCVIDLDRFNQINDALGHVAGDEVLAFVAMRLRSVTGQQALLARMGGDEFTMILHDIHNPDEAVARARRILAVLEEPLPLHGQELFISASIGISLFPQDGPDATTMLKHADSAMYRVKASGRNGVALFEPSIGAAARRRLDIEIQMRRALDLNQFELYYQPLIECDSKRVSAVEALIRWRHPDQGVLLPGDFIGVAEESNLIERLFGWGIVQACQRVAEWQQAHRRPLRVSVNISAREFERVDIVEQVADALKASSLDPQWLELEITESVVMRDPEGSATRIRRLAALGVRVALDDFGTGYSSLAYLQRFPVKRLKIDRSFIWALSPEPDPESSAANLLRAIAAMAHSLKLKIVAEGVESVGQQRFLAELGCDEIQGFLYARPTSADALWDVIADIEG